MDKAAAMGQRKECKNIKYKPSKDHFISSAVFRTICFIISIKTTETRTQPRHHDNKMTPYYNEF